MHMVHTECKMQAWLQYDKDPLRILSVPRKKYAFVKSCFAIIQSHTFCLVGIFAPCQWVHNMV